MREAATRLWESLRDRQFFRTLAIGDRALIVYVDPNISIRDGDIPATWEGITVVVKEMGKLSTTESTVFHKEWQSNTSRNRDIDMA